MPSRTIPAPLVTVEPGDEVNRRFAGVVRVVVAREHAREPVKEGLPGAEDYGASVEHGGTGSWMPHSTESRSAASSRVVPAPRPFPRAPG